MDIPNVLLSDGNKIPQIGFGTWLNKNKEECINSVKSALEAGYRHIDTAQIYVNEEYVGQAIKESSLPREKLFITTKIYNDNMFWDDIIPSLDESLKKLQTDYVDLLLLHFPVTELRRPAWRRMEDIVTSGKSKSIGVSNYTIKHLKELFAECRIKPAVNQIELHMFLQQPELVKFCQDNNIAVEAYSPLAHSYRGVFDNKVLVSIAKKHHKSSAQIMLRWCIEKGTIPLPKSTHPEYIRANIDIFDFKLDKEDMKLLEDLDSGLRTCWDPTNIA